MTFWRFELRRGPDDWIDLDERFEGDLEAVRNRCRELREEHGHLVNAVSVDEPEPVALAS